MDLTQEQIDDVIESLGDSVIIDEIRERGLEDRFDSVVDLSDFGSDELLTEIRYREELLSSVFLHEFEFMDIHDTLMALVNHLRDGGYIARAFEVERYAKYMGERGGKL